MQLGLVTTLQKTGVKDASENTGRGKYQRRAGECECYRVAQHQEQADREEQVE